MGWLDSAISSIKNFFIPDEYMNERDIRPYSNPLANVPIFAIKDNTFVAHPHHTDPIPLNGGIKFNPIDEIDFENIHNRPIMNLEEPKEKGFFDKIGNFFKDVGHSIHVGAEKAGVWLFTLAETGQIFVAHNAHKLGTCEGQIYAVDRIGHSGNEKAINIAAQYAAAFHEDVQAHAVATYKAMGTIDTELTLASQYGQYAKSAELPIHQIMLTSTHQEVLEQVASNVYKFDADNQVQAYNYTIQAHSENEGVMNAAASTTYYCAPENHSQIEQQFEPVVANYQSVQQTLSQARETYIQNGGQSVSTTARASSNSNATRNSTTGNSNGNASANAPNNSQSAVVYRQAQAYNSNSVEQSTVASKSTSSGTSKKTATVSSKPTTKTESKTENTKEQQGLIDSAPTFGVNTQDDKPVAEIKKPELESQEFKKLPVEEKVKRITEYASTIGSQERANYYDTIISQMSSQELKQVVNSDSGIEIKMHIAHNPMKYSRLLPLIFKNESSKNKYMIAEAVSSDRNAAESIVENLDFENSPYTTDLFKRAANRTHNYKLLKDIEEASQKDGFSWYDDTSTREYSA